MFESHFSFVDFQSACQVCPTAQVARDSGQTYVVSFSQIADTLQRDPIPDDIEFRSLTLSFRTSIS